MDNDFSSPESAAPGHGGFIPPPHFDYLQQKAEPDVLALGEFEGRGEATTLARLSADLELVNDLRLRGFDLRDSAYQLFAKALAEYGFSVLRVWMSKGLIYAKCAVHPTLRAYLAGFPSGFVFPPDQIESLAIDAVGEAIVVFREKVLIPGVWDPDKGASIKTFFIGQSLYHFLRVFRQWQSLENKRRKDDPLDNHDLDTRGASDPSEVIVRREDLERAMAKLKSPVKEILQLVAEGYQHQEIAEVLGVTIKQIESRLYRQRKALGGGST